MVDPRTEISLRAEDGSGPLAKISVGNVPVDAGRITLSEGPGGILRLTRAGDRCYPRVKIVQAAPLAEPNRFISFLDEKGTEIAMVGELAELEPESRRLARAALDRFYLVAEIRQIRSVYVEMGVSYWEVETDRGPRAFTLKDLQENVRDLGPDRLVIV